MTRCNADVDDIFTSGKRLARHFEDRDASLEEWKLDDDVYLILRKRDDGESTVIMCHEAITRRRLR